MNTLQKRFTDGVLINPQMIDMMTRYDPTGLGHYYTHHHGVKTYDNIETTCRATVVLATDPAKKIINSGSDYCDYHGFGKSRAILDSRLYETHYQSDELDVLVTITFATTKVMIDPTADRELSDYGIDVIDIPATWAPNTADDITDCTIRRFTHGWMSNGSYVIEKNGKLTEAAEAVDDLINHYQGLHDNIAENDGHKG